MNYFRMFLDLFVERVTAVRGYITAFVFGEPSIDGNNEDIFHDTTDDDEDIFYDAEGDEDIILPVETRALKGAAIHYTIKALKPTDPTSFLEFCKPTVTRLMKSETKVYIRLECTMKRTNPADNTEETVTKSFRSQTHIVFQNYIVSIYDGLVEETLEEFARYQMGGSGWTLKSTNVLTLSSVRWVPMKGSSYIPLPASLKNKKALINIKNRDNECFKWSVTRALHPVDKNSEKMSKILREQSERYNWDGISFPTPLKEISRFEKNNNVSINILGNNGDNRIYPLQRSNHKSDTKAAFTLQD